MPVLPSVALTDKLESALGYSFRDGSVLLEAMTHRTHCHEHPGDSSSFNERLEFLGDSVLGLVVSEYLFEVYPGEDEGALSRRKATLVQEAILARWARELDLGSALLLGRGEEISDGRDKPSLLSDAMEAVVAAVFRDGGWGEARSVVRRWIPWLEEQALDTAAVRDFKTELQERTQERWSGVPHYTVVSEEGPDHCKTFTVTVSVGDRRLGTGRGRNKKEAAQSAAREALETLIDT